MCDVHKLKLSYRKCNSTDIAVTVVEKNSKDEEIKIEICKKCWKKVANNDDFYRKEPVKKRKKRKA